MSTVEEKITRDQRCYPFCNNPEPHEQCEPVDLDQHVVDIHALAPPPVPTYWVIDQERPPEAVREGRRKGSVRTLSMAVLVGERKGEVVATAFEYPASGKRRAYWHIDVEHYAIKAAGLRPLGTDVGNGFVVWSEDEARDWLQFFGALIAAAIGGAK